LLMPWKVPSKNRLHKTFCLLQIIANALKSAKQKQATHAQDILFAPDYC
jgi:hypothetical protein